MPLDWPGGEGLDGPGGPGRALRRVVHLWGRPWRVLNSSRKGALPWHGNARLGLTDIHDAAAYLPAN